MRWSDKVLITVVVMVVVMVTLVLDVDTPGRRGVCFRFRSMAPPQALDNKQNKSFLTCVCFVVVVFFEFFIMELFKSQLGACIALLKCNHQPITIKHTGPYLTLTIL